MTVFAEAEKKKQNLSLPVDYTKTPNRLPNLRLIVCLIVCLIWLSVICRAAMAATIGNARSHLRGRWAISEGMSDPNKTEIAIRQSIRQEIRQKLGSRLGSFRPHSSIPDRVKQDYEWLSLDIELTNHDEIHLVSPVTVVKPFRGERIAVDPLNPTALSVKQRKKLMQGNTTLLSLADCCGSKVLKRAWTSGYENNHNNHDSYNEQKETSKWYSLEMLWAHCYDPLDGSNRIQQPPKSQFLTAVPQICLCTPWQCNTYYVHNCEYRNDIWKVYK
jgi:hypothetical protein